MRNPNIKTFMSPEPIGRSFGRIHRLVDSGAPAAQPTTDLDVRALAKVLGIDVDPAKDPAGFTSALEMALEDALAAIRGQDTGEDTGEDATKPAPSDPAIAKQLSEIDLAMCKRRGIDPAVYAATFKGKRNAAPSRA